MRIETHKDKHTIQHTGTARLYTPLVLPDKSITQWERHGDSWYAYTSDDYCAFVYTPENLEGYHHLITLNGESISVCVTRGLIFKVSECAAMFQDFDPSEWWDYQQYSVGPDDWVYVQLLELS